MTLPPVFFVIQQRGSGDCTIAALAILLGSTYEDVLEAAGQVARKPHRRGMWTTQIIKVAAALGATLVRKQKFNLEEDAGILCVGGVVPHVVVLRDGLLIDPADGCVWLEPQITYAGPVLTGPLLRLL